MSHDDGNQYWGRIAGTPYDKMTTDWVAAQYKRIGLEQVRVQEFSLPPQWFPTSWDVSVSGADKTVSLKTAFPLYASVGTNGQAAEWEPVWVGTGLPADFLGRDVRGKAAIIYGFPNPGGRENTASTFGAIATADRAGAAAILIVLGVPGNLTSEPAGGQTTPPASVPVFLIGNQDGTALREMIENRQAPKVKARLQTDMRTGLRSAGVFGVLPGMTDENVAVMAHTDSFFEGAMDNASGIATNVTLAEFYAGLPRSQLKAIVAKTFKEYGIALYSRPEVRPGGELGPMSTEAPSFHIIDHTVYHTDLDTLQAVPAYGLEQSARAFAKIIDEVNKLPLTQLRVNIPPGD